MNARIFPNVLLEFQRIQAVTTGFLLLLIQLSILYLYLFTSYIELFEDIELWVTNKLIEFLL